MKRIHAIWLAVLLLLCMQSAALSEGIILPGKDWREAYDEMVAAVELGRYDDARKTIREYQLVELNVKDSREYDLYLRGLESMDQGAYAEAAGVFYSLARIEDEEAVCFRNSDTLYYYCAGRSVEAAGDYAGAVKFFNLCLSYGDAVTRMMDCMSKQSNARIAEADRKYEQALILLDAALMEEAQAIYSAVGNAEKAALCRKEVVRIRNLQAYQAAMLQYEEARLTGNIQGLSTAASVFSALGDFENSGEMVSTIHSLITALQRKISAELIAKGSDSISIRLIDTGSADGYCVSWHPVNAGEGQQCIVREKVVDLTGLIPDTEYEISVAADGAVQPSFTLRISTDRAKKYQTAGFRVSNSALIGIKRIYLSISSIDELLSKSPQVLEYPQNNQIALANTVPSAQDRVYCYSFTYRQDQKQSEPVVAQWVLRTRNAGVYVTTGSTIEDMPASGRLYCELESLLAQLYQAHNGWPKETSAIELYLDGELAATGLLDFSE